MNIYMDLSVLLLGSMGLTSLFFAKTILNIEINKLNSRDKEIMILRYGLNGHEEMTQKEVAELLGISQSYISRIEKKVIKRLSSIIKI